MGRHGRLRSALSYAALFTLGVMTFLPFLLMLHISLKNNAQFYAYFWSFKGLSSEVVKRNYLYNVYDPGSALLEPDHIPDWRAFCADLRDTATRQQTGPASRLWEQAPEAERREIAAEADGGGHETGWRGRTLEALNAGLKRRDLLRAEDVAGLAMSAEGRALFARDAGELNPREVEERNRLALEAQFPRDIANKRRKGSDLQWKIGSHVLLAHVGKVAWSIRNSLFVSVVTVAGVLFFSSLSAYVFARYPFPGRKGLFALIIVLIMIPGEFAIVALYVFFKHLGLINSLWALILPYWAGAQVVSIYILRGFFQTIPQDFFDAAKIDGAGEFAAYRLIALPLSKPILVTVGLMNILGTWNDFVWPSVVLGDQKLWTLAVQLRSLEGEYAIEFGQMMAGYTIGCIPILILFFFTMNYFVKGLTTGAIKA